MSLLKQALRNVARLCFSKREVRRERLERVIETHNTKARLLTAEIREMRKLRRQVARSESPDPRHAGILERLHREETELLRLRETVVQTRARLQDELERL